MSLSCHIVSKVRIKRTTPGHSYYKTFHKVTKNIHTLNQPPCPPSQTHTSKKMTKTLARKVLADANTKGKYFRVFF